MLVNLIELSIFVPQKLSFLVPVVCQNCRNLHAFLWVKFGLKVLLWVKNLNFATLLCSQLRYTSLALIHLTHLPVHGLDWPIIWAYKRQICTETLALKDYRTIWHQDNLAPRTIWHRGQFGTGQFGTADNLAPRTIWHHGQFGTVM